MQKTKNFINTNKKIIMIISGIIVAIAVFLIGFMFLSGNSREKELKELLEGMGRDFYENFYYDGLKKEDAEKEAFLKKYESQGIKIDLNNLSRFNPKVNETKVKEFVNPKTEKPCDKEKSKVIIYPKSNYGKKDYDIKVELVCGFTEEEQNEENKEK